MIVKFLFSTFVSFTLSFLFYAILSEKLILSSIDPEKLGLSVALLLMIIYPLFQTILLFVAFDKIAKYKIPLVIFPIFSIISYLSLYFGLDIGSRVFNPIQGRSISSGIGFPEFYISYLLIYLLMSSIFYLFIRRKIKRIG